MENTADKEYVLAMYDVRGKQNYIFRGTKLKEIVGGSLIIRDIFDDYLYPAADEYAKEIGNPKTEGVIFNYKVSEPGQFDVSFTRGNFKIHMASGYLGEVIYNGGGNFIILYKNEDTYTGINKIFTKNVLKGTYSLTVLCSHISGVNFDNYTTVCPEGCEKRYNPGDREKLYNENRKREARINPQMPSQVLPFTQIDKNCSMPLYKYSSEISAKLTREAAAKYEKYNQAVSKDSDFEEKVLDNIASEKGTDSWIAVMYIDGNNMGAKVQGLFGGSIDSPDLPVSVSYEEAVSKLREFSARIQKEYVEERIQAIDKALCEKYSKENSTNDYKRRLVVYAGDEINIILNAHDAYAAAKAYFQDMKGGSACAGIAIFKSHAPYADAYRIAEQACESGKIQMKEYGMQEANLMDFHYCQGAIGADLEEIREKETGGIISRPWFVNYTPGQGGNMPEAEVVTCEMIEDLAERLNTCTRSNIKGLLDCAKNSESELLIELTRMQLRRKNTSTADLRKINDVSGNIISSEMLRKMVYDVVSVYDLWFRK